jgi:1-phosphatidylinositol phosphodiesterase
MSSPVTVRNLTLTSILIERVEQYEDPNTQQTKAGGYLFGSKDTQSVGPSSPRLEEHEGSFQRHDLGITLHPFESYTLGLTSDVGISASNTTLRFTIKDGAGSRHRIDAHPTYTQKSLQASTPLSPSSSTSYITLFHPSRPTAHLTIHTNHFHDYKRWMSTLPDALPLSAISIPGTHNSHTYYRALPSVRCQMTDIKAQLEQGIRFLDIRLQPANGTDPTKKELYLVHGAFPISLTGPKYFAPILQICYDFLSTNSSETILVSLKREGIGSATDAHLAQILEEHYITPNASKWHLNTSIPYLGAVRGKLVLIRRYNTTTLVSGLDATPWPHNATHALFPQIQTPLFCLQDFCEILIPESIATKVQHANEHLVRAAACQHHIPGHTTDATSPVPPEPLYLNFLSGSNFWKKACWPENIAKVVNQGMEEWLCVGHHLEHQEVEESTRHPEVLNARKDVVRKKGKGDGCTGVVVMDRVGEGGDWDLVRLVIGMNAGVLMKLGVQNRNVK